jgi:acetyl-CoA C-acetyltransferase
LLGQVIAEVLKRAKVDGGLVGQVVGGCINKVGAQAFNVTRTAWLTAGLSPDVACSTIDSQCGSSQFAVNLAANMIASGWRAIQQSRSQNDVPHADFSVPMQIQISGLLH